MVARRTTGTSQSRLGLLTEARREHVSLPHPCQIVAVCRRISHGRVDSPNVSEAWNNAFTGDAPDLSTHGYILAQLDMDTGRHGR